MLIDVENYTAALELVSHRKMIDTSEYVVRISLKTRSLIDNTCTCINMTAIGVETRLDLGIF